MFEIEKTYLAARCCAGCGASNYKSEDRREVAPIYELKIGCMVNALCSDCLKALAMQIETEFWADKNK